jgi:hypothetical protein
MRLSRDPQQWLNATYLTESVRGKAEARQRQGEVFLTDSKRVGRKKFPKDLLQDL